MKLALDFLTYVSDLYTIPLKTPKRIEIILEHAVIAFSADDNQQDQNKVDVPFFQDTDGEFLLSTETIIQFESHAKTYRIRNNIYPTPVRILVPKQNFCCGKVIRLQSRYANVTLYCETGVEYARSYHGVCKVCKKSHYCGYWSDENSRDYSGHLESDYLLTSTSTGFSKDFLLDMDRTIFIGVVSVGL